MLSKFPPEKWRRICEEEPRLAALLAEIESIDNSDPDYCAENAWYGWMDKRAGFRYRMRYLVGDMRNEPEPDDDEPDLIDLGSYAAGESHRAWRERHAKTGYLGGSEAYDVTYATLYNALPRCTHGAGRH